MNQIVTALKALLQFLKWTDRSIKEMQKPVTPEPAAMEMPAAPPAPVATPVELPKMDVPLTTGAAISVDASAEKPAVPVESLKLPSQEEVVK